MLNLSPSVLGLYFYFECPRFLVFRSTPSKAQKSAGVPGFDQSHSPVTRAIMKGGYLWEEEVVEKKLKKRALVAKAERGKKTRDKVFDVAESIEKLKTMKNGEYLYQASLQAPDSFYAAYNIDPKVELTVNNCRPDLIYCRESDGKRLFEVIDLKASDHIKTSHKIQVGFYSILLEHILPEHNIKGEVNKKKGGVWHYDRDEPDLFEMQTILPHIEEFLRMDLKSFAAKKAADLDWHLYYRCEGCEYYGFCRQEAADKCSVSLLPYLTVHGRKFLRHRHIGSHTLKDLEKFLKRKDADSLLARSASLKGKTEKLKHQVRSLLKNEIVSLESSSTVMPLTEKIRYILAAESDPVSGKTYLLGFKRHGGKDLFSSGQEDAVFIAASEDDCETIRRQFIGALYESLVTVHNYNCDNKDDWHDQFSVQSYVFDTYTIELINQALLEGLSDEDTAEKALDLLFHFQNENLIAADDHPEEESTFPVVVLTSAIKELFAVPVSTAFNLSRICNEFKKETSAYTYKGSSYFDFELSSQLKSDAIFSVWNDGNTKNIDSIRIEVKRRLNAIQELIWGIRQKAADSEGNPVLFAYPPRFFFPDSQKDSSKVLSRLSFITKYEKLLEFLEIKQSRTLSRKERIDSGILFIAEAIFDDSTDFICYETDYEDVLEHSFGWLLSDDSPEGDRAQMAYNDYYYRNKPYVPGNSAVWNVNIDEIKPGEKGRLYLSLNMRRGGASPLIRKGKRYLLQRKFSDFISDRVVSRLRQLDSPEYRHVPLLLEEPEKFLRRFTENKKLAGLAAEYKKKFTPSQENALSHFFSYNLTLVWGPPGTGKTHFIAQAVLLLLEHFRRIDKPCSIYITAFTHAAIENCLNKIMEINSREKIWKEENCIYKLDNVKMEKFSGLDTITGGEMCASVQGGARSMFGGTVYALSKALRNSDAEFDAVIIDEASQLRTAEALIPVSVLNKLNGRLMIVGDDKQLPPIAKGIYPEPEEGELPLHRSVFEVIRTGDYKGGITCQLTENFRMNSVLCGYPAAMIYGEEYKSFNKEIGERKIRLKKHSKDPLIRKMLDPDYPLVVCVLEGGMTGSESEVEAELTAMISKELRTNLIDGETGKVYEDTIKGDMQFWRNGLSIVSPHHVQINLIKSCLKEQKLREPFFVDTVDKMQGQECDAVIVSYGVSDPEQATLEGEFIYSLNRLNVSLTRARAKSIVFIPQALLRPTLQVLENEDMADGIAYMLGLEKFAEEGEKHTGSLEGHKDVKFTIYCRK